MQIFPGSRGPATKDVCLRRHGDRLPGALALSYDIQLEVWISSVPEVREYFIYNASRRIARG